MWAKRAFKSVWYSLLAILLSPVIAYISLKEEVLPAWAWPFLTYDNPIDGDEGHLARWPKTSKFQIWLRRTAWLWRNKAYNYDYYINGISTKEDVVVVKGNPFWQQPNGKGLCYAKCGKAWMLFAWYPYSLFGWQRGVRVYLGWKLRNKIDNPSSERAMLVTHINPFKGKM